MTPHSLSVVYYTCNRIAHRFAEAVRAELLKSVDGRFPIVCVSHQPLDFGDVRIVVGDVKQTVAQVYRNILAGCKAIDTEFCAFAEDDTLYVPEHFDYRPDPDVFAYNEHRYVITRRLSDDRRSRTAYFYFRPRTQMAQGLCARSLMIATLEEKFERYPTPPDSTTVAKKMGFGEPGRYEHLLGLTPRKLLRFKWSARPNCTWNHTDSLMGRRQVQPSDIIRDEIAPWGKADDLWTRIHG